MPWVKLDEQFRHHPKVIEAGALGIAVYVCGLTYAAEYLTDGFIPTRAVRTLIDLGHNLDPLDTAEHLVAVGLWVPVEGGFLIHDYLDYNPSKEQVLAERAAKKAAGQAGGQARAKALAQAPATAPAKADAQAKSKPVPVPVPVTVSDSVIPVSNDAREVDDGREDLEAYVLVTGRAPTPRQRKLLDDIVDRHDISGPGWAAKLILQHPDDPIGAVKEADRAWRQERIAEAQLAERPQPKPKRRPGLPESTREILAHWAAAKEEEGAA